MNRVNPLHVTVLLLIIIVFLFTKILNIQSDIAKERQAFVKNQHIAKKLYAYKKLYVNNQQSRESLKKFFSQKSLKQTKLKLLYHDNTLGIITKSISLDSLNALISKILNTGYRIKLIEIEQIDETHAKVHMEIIW